MNSIESNYCKLVQCECLYKYHSGCKGLCSILFSPPSSNLSRLASLTHMPMLSHFVMSNN